MSTDTHAMRKLFANNVRRERNSRGWSQEVLADAANLHRTYIGSIERCERNVSIDNITRIAAALELSPDALLRDNDVK